MYPEISKIEHLNGYRKIKYKMNAFVLRLSQQLEFSEQR